MSGAESVRLLEYPVTLQQFGGEQTMMAQPD